MIADLKIKSASQLANDFEPSTLQWLVTGLLFGFSLLLVTSFEGAPLHVLIHDRGPTQAPAVIAGSMVFSFTLLKFIKLRNEQKQISRRPAVSLLSLQRDSVEESLRLNATTSGVLSSRFRILVDLWRETNSSTKVLDALEVDTDRFDIAFQNSFTLPRMLAWGIPILGFLGTVVGIGASVGQFEGLLVNVGDIDNLRQGLTKVTAGLGTAFDTTLLSLTISLIITLPLAAAERKEQQLLSLIDQILRTSILPVLPDPNTLGSAVDRRTLEVVIGEAVRQLQPMQIATQVGVGEQQNRDLALESSRAAAREIVAELKSTPLFQHDYTQMGSMDLQALVEVAEAAARDITQALNSYHNSIAEVLGSQHNYQPLLDSLNEQCEQTRSLVLQFAPALEDLSRQISTMSNPRVSEIVESASTGESSSISEVSAAMMYKIASQLESSIARDNAKLIESVVAVREILGQSVTLSDEKYQGVMESLSDKLERLSNENVRTQEYLVESLFSRFDQAGNDVKITFERIEKSLVREVSSGLKDPLDSATKMLINLVNSVQAELRGMNELYKNSLKDGADRGALIKTSSDNIASFISTSAEEQTQRLTESFDEGVQRIANELQANHQSDILQKLNEILPTLELILSTLNKPRRLTFLENHDNED